MENFFPVFVSVLIVSLAVVVLVALFKNKLMHPRLQGRASEKPAGMFSRWGVGGAHGDSDHEDFGDDSDGGDGGGD